MIDVRHAASIGEALLQKDTPVKNRSKTTVLVCAVIFGLFVQLLIIYSSLFYLPSTSQYSYKKESCAFGAGIFPVVESSTNDTFAIKSTYLINVGRLRLITYKNCIEPRVLPAENTSYTVKLKQLWLPVYKSITIKTSLFPSLSPKEKREFISPASSLLLGYEENNIFPFNYQISDGVHNTVCLTQAESIECPLAPLQLLQGEVHDLQVLRSYGGKQEKAFNGQYRTVEPLSVVTQSISGNEVIYDVRNYIEFTFSKNVEIIEGELKDESGKTFPTEITDVAEASARFSWKDELERGKKYVFTLKRATSSDGSYLENNIITEFTLSRGPSVSSTSIDSYGVSIDATISITFDQNLASTQDADLAITLNSTKQLYSIKNNSLTLENNELNACQQYTIMIPSTIKNEYGVKAEKDYEYSFRTRCSIIDSIGTSVSGRNIVSYTFGSGSETVLFVGATHGNEKSSKYILDSFMDYLERNPSAVPLQNRVVIIPSLNPDGIADSRRTNDNNVDLNRNFPANNWKPAVLMPDGSYLEYGGGTEPLSEPESSAIANYVRNVRPTFIATYHATGGIVMANGSGNSYSIASRYAEEVGYGDESYSTASEVFTHDTTGAFEDWVHDELDIPALLVELEGYTYNEFDEHLSAMLQIIQN